jgi:hypothetical protein
VAYTERDVWERGGGRCYLCGQPLAPVGWQIEHVIAIDRGGPDVLANVMPAHRLCNQRKGTRVVALPTGELGRAICNTLLVCARLASPRVGFPTVPRRPAIAPHVSTLRLATVPGHAHAPASVAAEVRAAVKNEHARVYVAGDELRVEIPRTVRRLVTLADLPPRRGLLFGIGLDTNNAPVGIDLATSPHIGIAGQSGSGKSVLLQVIVGQLAAAGARLVLVDADGATFEPFARLSALDVQLARDVAAAHDAAVYVQRAMDARPVDIHQPPLVLAIDELHTLRRDTRDVIQDIAQRGRKRRVFVVLATHRPTADVLPKVLTDQLTWAVAGGVGDVAGSRVIIGKPGAEMLRGNGDMILSHGGRCVRFQAALGTAADWARLPMRATEPEAAPEATPTDTRNVRKPDDQAVAWAVERALLDGKTPSATAIQREFGGAMDAARRRRDAALQALAVA